MLQVRHRINFANSIFFCHNVKNSQFKSLILFYYEYNYHICNKSEER